MALEPSTEFPFVILYPQASTSRGSAPAFYVLSFVI